MGAPHIAVVVKGWPRLSETFIAQELLGLERRGLDLAIISLRHPTDPAVHPMHREIRAPLVYLPEYLHQEPGRVLRAWRRGRGLPGWRRAQRLWRADLVRDPTPNRVRRFGQALVLACEVPPSVELLYAHYLHTPASVARYTAALLGLPFCVSAHAKDIWTLPAWEKREKLRDCRWLTTCTRDHARHLQALAPAAEVLLTYHGLDASRFPAPAPGRGPGPDGSDPARPVRLLGVARLVAKKGVDVLLAALAALPPHLHWRYDHIGGGPLKGDLERQAQRLGIAERVGWRGALPQDEVLAAYRAADLFVLASRIAADGDRDGLPNVLMEAGSQELAVVASEVGAVAELIDDGATGRLVPPEAPAVLRDVLAALIADPAQRLRLGRAARTRIATDFATDPGLDRLAARLRGELPAAHDVAA